MCVRVYCECVRARACVSVCVCVPVSVCLCVCTRAQAQEAEVIYCIKNIFSKSFPLSVVDCGKSCTLVVKFLLGLFNKIKILYSLKITLCQEVIRLFFWHDLVFEGAVDIESCYIIFN